MSAIIVSVVPHGACIVRSEWPIKDRARRAYHVLNTNLEPLCGRDAGGEMEPFEGTKRLCRDCERVEARIIQKTGGFFSENE